MTCFHPLTAYRTPAGGIAFNRGSSFVDLPVHVPCGQCIGCRLEYSRQWALRCVHEASLYQSNLFLTLTYNDENLPLYNSLNKRHAILFMKRVRKKFGSGIRFFLAGEYGETTARPHYHVLMFNFDLPDKKYYSQSADGHRNYTSQILDKIWGLGSCMVGNVTFHSAAYVARYAVKKVRGKHAAAHYGNRIPEFSTKSLKPGIGARWYEKFYEETYPSDFIVHNGSRMRPPKAYDKWLEANDPELYAAVRRQRVRDAAEFGYNQTPERLAVREEVKTAQVSILKRNL